VKRSSFTRVGLFRVKNIRGLILAFNDLHNEFPEWMLEIRGVTSDRSYYDECLELVSSLELTHRISILSSLSEEELYRRYASTSIYCLPSYYGEGMPTTILEAMYFGGSILSSRSGSISYLLDDGQCGMLIKPGEVKD